MFLVAVVVLVSLRLLQARSAAQDEVWLAGEPSGSFLVSVLHRQGHTGFVLDPRDFCVEAHTRDPHWGCTEAELKPRLAAPKPRDGKIPSCVMVGVPPGGRAQVSFDMPASTAIIKGWLHAPSNEKPILGQVIFGDSTGHPAARIGLSTPSGQRFRIPVPAGAERAVFSFDNPDPSITRVCLEAAAIGQTSRK